jgi:hypothetical protein
LKDHSKDEATLYSRVGGFWAPLLWQTHQNGKLAGVQDVIAESRQARVELVRLSHEEAKVMWRPRAEVISLEIFKYTRPTEESPLDDLLIELRDPASAPHSAEASDGGEYVREPELTDEELIEVVNREERERPPTPEPPRFSPRLPQTTVPLLPWQVEL